MKTKKLPNKLSALILLALDDLKRAERSKKYEVNMHLWHSPNSHCNVCFAGGVMAFSLGANSNDLLDPLDFDHDTSRKLNALNLARIGNFGFAQSWMMKSDKIKDKTEQFDCCIPVYELNRRGFHSTLRKSAHKLKKAGL